MQCYTELVAPTAVSHAARLSFRGPATHDLVVAKTSLLQLLDVTATPHGPRLSLVAEYALSGTVTALAPVSLSPSKSGGAALLVAFKDAKLSLVEWSPDDHRISTVSIHYYEGEGILHQPFGPKIAECDTYLTVDPDSRCAALKFGARSLAIVPFRQPGDDLADDGADGDGDTDMTLRRGTLVENGEAAARDTPYKPSFVLPLTMLDAELTQPIHMAFLHKYREPTFGILSGAQQPSSALLADRKDCVNYTVLALGLEDKSVTPLVSITKLPSDLWKVVPLPDPVGGVLLLGTNELVHVDQAGKANAVALNEFAKQASAFPMTDQSELQLKLEHCEVAMLENGSALLVLNDGTLAVIGFKLLGRNVGGLTVTPVAAESGGMANGSAPSCITTLRDHNVFIGSEDGNSTLLGWTNDKSTLGRKRSHAEMLGHHPNSAGDDDAEEMDEDDLYAPSAEAVKRAKSPTAAESAIDVAASYRFEIRDELQSLAPVNHLCFGTSPQAGPHRLETLASIGRGRSSKLAFMSREIRPQAGGSWRQTGVKDAWGVRVKTTIKAEDAEADQTQQYLFAYDGSETKAYTVQRSTNASMHPPFSDSENITEKTGTDWESEGETLYVGTLAKGATIAQCRRNEIRLYDSELGLSQIIPMFDEESDTELSILTVDICDPYLLVLRDDSTIQVHEVTKSGEVEEVEYPVTTSVKQKKWFSACLYSGAWAGGETLVAALPADGALHIFSLPGLTPVHVAAALPLLPPVLAQDTQLRRGARATLTELLLADLGPEHVQQTYLVLRTADESLVIYEPYHSGQPSQDERFGDLRWRKVPHTYIPKYDPQLDDPATPEDVPTVAKPARMMATNVAGRSAIYLPGSSPSLIIKEAASRPKILGIALTDVRTLAPMRSVASTMNSLVLVDKQGRLQAYSIPPASSFDTGWQVETLSLGEEVRHVAYHEARGVYVVVTCRDVDFEWPADIDEKVRASDEATTLRPQVPCFTLHLLSAKSRTLIQSVLLEPLDLVTSMKVLQIEVSEQTREQKPMIVLGTAALRGEDMPARGSVTVFDIIDVVPDPEKPESGIAMKLVSREETKGAVTAVEGMKYGLIGTSQGMKIMVRGLKEDGSCLPVAFLDAQCYGSTLKSLGDTGMWLLGDAWKGLWFGGWTEEPYRLLVMGKSRAEMEVVQAEFLPFDGGLYLCVVDGNCDLHILQYDPEHPNSLNGLRLLRRGEFHLGHFPTSMALLPSSLKSAEAQQRATNGDRDQDTDTPAPSLHHILVSFSSGALGILTPLEESAYRRLGGLQTYLANTLEHACGLNPRAYRASRGDGEGAKGVLDGGLIARVGELGLLRRGDALSRAGMDGWGLRGDLEVLGGGGLGFL
ncbi:mRNA cleavage [Teratosphaeria destructans]|uniref:mRNA cleavage n=1 Tax=Teratosphaeria destructans TaxID=418781 RepID=A0A9W7SNJ5_9PEZI|nr:mRNA cleavage [Teratosphaeria destructans]